MQNICDSPLYPIMHPRSVAVVGASNSIANMGATILNNMRAFDFEGEIYPVHPRLKEILGLRAYADPEEIPKVPDLAVIVVPTPVVPQVLESCGKKGVRRAVIVSGGFREAGEPGQKLESDLLSIAGRYGIRFIGPNCIGVVNPGHRFNTTMFPYNAAMNGFIGMVSQSGSFITQMFTHLEKFGLGFSQGISVGNQADIDLAACIDYLGACERTKVIGLYIEGLHRPGNFVRTLKEAAAKKPVVAMYVGGTEAGSRAGHSHTGALSGSDALYNGLFRQCGVIRAYSIEELFDFCWVLGTQPLMEANRVVVFTNSGGPGAAAADAAERAGLYLPPPSTELQEKLLQLVPRTASLKNPIDLTFTRNYEDILNHIPRVLLEDAGTDGILMYFLINAKNLSRLIEKLESPLFQTIEAFETYIGELCRQLAQMRRKYGKPLVGSTFSTRSEGAIRLLEDLGIPVLPSPERSARALGALYRYSMMRKRLTDPR